MRLFRVKFALASHIWLVPLLCLLGGIGLAFVTLGIDKANDYQLVLQSVTGSPAAVQQILSTAASALVSLTSVVLSLTLVAVQLAMGQFSPRIVRALLTDRRSQLAIGLFLATFAHAMLTLRDVNDVNNTIPGLSVVVDYSLIGLSVMVLVLFVHQAGQSIRVSGLIDLVGDSTREQLERRFPRHDPEAPALEEENAISARCSGNIVLLNEAWVAEAARRADCVLEMPVGMGDFVSEGATIFRIVEGSPSEKQRERIREGVVLARERTHDDDPAFGIRKLVDIAERSIASSPFDDPTTTVQAIHRLHDCLRLIATREFPSGRLHDSEGALRLTIPVLDWDGYVRLSFDELRLVGAASPQVARALRAVLENLKAVSAPDRHPPLDRQLSLLADGVRRGYEDDADVEASLQPDELGIGAGADVLVTDGRARS